jgi:hypothetical protein
VDPNRFDRLSRTIAGGISRRVRTAAPRDGAGAARIAAPLAQAGQPLASPEARLFTIPFDATVRIGPNAGSAYVGMLNLAVEPDGRVDQGRFSLVDGTALPVVGQIQGRSLGLLFELGEGRNLYGVGSAAAGIEEQFGDSLGGPFAGPNPGDIGDWEGGMSRRLPGYPDTPEGNLQTAICSSCREFAGLLYDTSPNSGQAIAACQAEGSCP